MDRFNIVYKVNKKGKTTSEIEHIIDTSTGEVLKPIFTDLVGEEQYRDSGVFPLNPMLAKEFLNEEDLNKQLDNDRYIAEEKLDGIRGLLYINESWARSFGRNLTKEHQYYQEFSNHMPLIRDYQYYADNDTHDITILDGEFFIPDTTFKEVSSCLGSKWDVAIAKQKTYGAIHLNAFDILYYKGTYIGTLPLKTRKRFLRSYLKEIDCPYINFIEGFTKTIKINDYDYLLGTYSKMTKSEKEGMQLKYPSLCKFILDPNSKEHPYLDKRGYFEYVVFKGGEGIMLKDSEGKYHQKRCREYTKWKKLISRECVLLYFKDPTKVYTGKDEENWMYWYHDQSDAKLEGKYYDNQTSNPMDEVIPVTKHWFMGWVGKMVLGVLATDKDIEDYARINKIPTNKVPVFISSPGYKFIEVVECEGYDEELRKDMTDNELNYIGRIVEVQANEIFKKTGKLRHPRYLRFRDDKTIKDCTWYNHINQ